jgi:DNA-binding NtrC family response regulator
VLVPAAEPPLLIDPEPAAFLGAIGAGQPVAVGGSLPLLDDHGEVRPLEELEADTIRFAIAHYRGQMSEVARRLRIGRSTLYRKLEGLGLGSPAEPEDGVAAR